MSPHVPSKKQLADGLAQTVRQMYAADEREALTVNVVRTRTEEKLGLDSGFFKDDAWKNESKQIIKETVDKLEAESEPPTPAKKTANVGRKRAAADEATPSPAKKKRQMKKPAAAKRAKSESELSELSDASDASEASEPPAKRKRIVSRGRRKSNQTVPSDSEEEDDQEEGKDESEASDFEATPKKRTTKKVAPKKAAPKKKAAKKVVTSDSEDEDGIEVGNDDFEPRDIGGTPKKASPKKAAPKINATIQPEVKADAAESESALSEPAEVESEKPTGEKKPPPVDDSSESEVFDEPPKRKRKSKETSAKPPAKSKAKAKTSTAKTKADISPDEEEIKKLQGQLVKCGVRKIWAFELKQFEDDSRAKIRHLKDMLKDVGMDGRFSDSKAREIKERRELLAELEAVNEMNEELGWGAGGRPSRSRAARPKKLALDVNSDDPDGEDDADKGTDDGVEDDDDDVDEDEDPYDPRAEAKAKRRADFAFLGSDEESD